MWIDLLYHPRYRLWRHLFIIVAIFSTALSQTFFVFSNSMAIPTRTIYLFGTGFAMGILAIIYFNVYVLAPQFLTRKRYASYGLILLGMVSCLVFIKLKAESALFSDYGIHREWTAITLLDGMSNMVLYAICVASTSIGILLRQLRADDSEIENLENRQLKKRVEEIRSSIHPKFLYATLEYAAENVKADPNHTSQTLLRLSDLLRYQLYDCARDKVLLNSYVGFLRSYLLLHQQNSRNAFSFQLSLDGDGHRLIPSYLFTPCIEAVLSYRPAHLLVTITVHEGCAGLQCKAERAYIENGDIKQTLQELQMVYGEDIDMRMEADTLHITIQPC